MSADSTRHSVTHIMSTEVLVLSHSQLLCLHVFLLTIFLYFPSWILILSLSRSENLFSYIYLAEGPWSTSKTMLWWLIITTVPCHIVNSQGYHDHFSVQSCIDQEIAAFCPCYHYTLEGLGHCPDLGRGQEVRVTVSSALPSDWTACLCQRRFPQFNAPCRN